MELFRKIRQWNTKILTFSQRKGFDVTRYHCSCSSSPFVLNKCDNSVNNEIREGYAENVSSRLTTRKTALPVMASNIPKIVIIGAGAAGIAAATRLLENGMNDLIVLEAENRIGGRIHSVEFDGSTVDLGGQWCHGQKGNIVYDLVKDLDLLSSSHNNYTDFTFYSSDGSVVDRSVTDRLLEILDEVADDEEAARKAKGTYGDYVTNEYRKRVSRLFGDNEQIRHMSEPLLNWFHKLMINLDPADSWFELSSAGPFYYKECEGDLYLQWRNKGFKTILDVLMKKVPDITKQLPLDGKIFLNKEVNRILWDSKIVNGGGVTVDCSDGSSYNCDHVIITVSLGVLKNLSKTFIPELPFAKQKAIEVMDIGNVKKILLKFPTQWWPDHVKGFSLIWNEEDRKNLVDEFPYGPCEDGRSWLEDVFGFYVVDSHPKILLCWVVGKMIERIEQLSDDVVVDGCIFLLKKFLGQKYNISQPDAVLRSKWKTNPHFNGCYTYQCLEADKVNISARDLASPVVNSSGRQVLLFAGEATHANYFSTVHGAIETGYREAERISKIYKSAKLIRRKVVIIGAGMAGLGAATTLHKLGCTDFVVLEAQCRAGGRVHTLELDDNILELGAQWIHGRENPLYELALQHDLLSEITSEEGLGLYVRDNGEIIDEDVVKRVDFEVGKILSECEEFVGAADYPKSVGEYMSARFTEYLNKCDDPDDMKEIKLELFDWHVRFQVIDNSCLNLKHLSAKGWGEYVCADDKAHINLKCGYSELVRILVDDLPKGSLLLSTPVKEIRRSTVSDETNKIICNNGSIITCDHVIVTPSLGVLKRLKITPPLPPGMSENIEHLGFHGVGKIFLIFDHKWWDVDGFQFVWGRKYALTYESRWIRYITGFDPVLHGPTALVGWVGGEGVKLMEGLSDEDVRTHCMILFRRFIRDRIIPDPVKVIRTTWFSNPWVLGGYSHITPDCDRLNLGMHQLSEPIFVDGKPRLLIAGEAAHSSHYSTTHGAYESGKEQAELLAEYMMKNSKL